MNTNIEKINERVALAKANPELPFTFAIAGKWNPTITDAKDKRNATGDVQFPACLRLVFDKGDGSGIKQHILLYNGNESIFNGEEIYKNERGRFEEPPLPRIKFSSGQKLVYGDSLANINLIEYLSYAEYFSKNVTCRDVTTPIKNANITTEDIVKYASLVDAMAKTDEGFELIKSIAKNSKLNPEHQTVEGISKMEGGKQRVLSIVKSFISNPTKYTGFVTQILPADDIMRQTKTLLEKGIVGYNKSTQSFQEKAGDSFAKEVIYTTKQDNDVTRLMLFAHFLQRNSEWRVKLQNSLEAASKKVA